MEHMLRETTLQTARLRAAATELRHARDRGDGSNSLMMADALGLDVDPLVRIVTADAFARYKDALVRLART